VDATDGRDYPWYQVASSISKVQIEYGISYIPKHAFDGSETSHAYSRLKEVNLPSTISYLDQYAFAHCDNLYFDLNKLPDNVTILDDAFSHSGCVAGDLLDNLSDMESNFNTISIMSFANTADVTLKGRTLYKDGNWNTICLPFDVEPSFFPEFSNAKIMQLDDANSSLVNGNLTLNFSEVSSILNCRPYLIKWDKADDYDTNPQDVIDPICKGVQVTDNGLVDVTFDGCSFVGQFDNFAITDENIDEIILLGAGNTLGYASEPRNLRPFRAHFSVPAPNDGGQGVKSYSISFGDDDTGTGIIDLRAHPQPLPGEGRYYTLDGRRLPGKPVEKGVYIHNGVKVVIK
jgi:hypothetical protein